MMVPAAHTRRLLAHCNSCLQTVQDHGKCSMHLTVTPAESTSA
jgi:hypothetical protein